MTSNNAFVARMCIVEAVVTGESDMASYFLETVTLNDSYSDMCTDLAEY